MENTNLVLDGHKLQWHKERVNAWLNGERIAPITIDCALTTACNYNCVYCYGKLQKNEGKKFTRDVILNFLDDAAEIDIKAISFVSDGESTCSPYLYEAIIHGKKNGIDMALGTNGVLLKKEKLEEILPALTYLRFNVSAGEPERYAEIHGCKTKYFNDFIGIVTECVAVKKRKNLETTIGLQMVFMPHFADQILPLAKLGKDLGVDYLVIKHCSDDEKGQLGVDYSQYFDEKLLNIVKEAEKYSTKDYLVKAKWSKILSGGKKNYSACYGAQFITQFSGSGLVAPCGMLFNNKYKEKFHIGNIVDTSFKDIWKSERYWGVMNYLASDSFNVHTMCASLCLQHKVNEYLWNIKQGIIKLEDPKGKQPMHVNFI